MQAISWKTMTAMAAVGVMLVVGCGEDDSDDSSMAPPTIEQIAHTWRVVREVTNTNFVGTSTEIEFGGAVLDITSQFIISYQRRESDSCYCPDSISYRLSGNTIVITDSLVDMRFRRMFGNYTMTYALAGTNLRISITGSVPTEGDLPAGTPFTMTMSYIPYTGVFPPPRCAVCDIAIPVSKRLENSAGTAGIIGRWQLSGTSVRVSGTTTEDTSYSSTTQIYRFRTDSVYLYEYDSAENAGCYTQVGGGYGLQGSTLSGELFAGSETDSNSQYSYSTTAGMSGDMLVLTTRTQMTEHDSASSWQTDVTTTRYLMRYDGPVPPTDWPQRQCLVIPKGRIQDHRVPLMRIPCVALLAGECD